MEKEKGGKILIAVKDGKVVLRVQIGILTQDELAMLITNLRLLENEFLNTYGKSIRRIDNNE